MPLLKLARGEASIQPTIGNRSKGAATSASRDAKARFSEFLETCLVEGPQMVSKRGSEAAVIVPVDEWRR